MSRRSGSLFSEEIATIDLTALRRGGDAAPVGAAIHRACTTLGFFYVVGHGVDPALTRRLEALSQQFFDLPVEQKMEVRMELGGRAWRGYFPLGDELTSGLPDQKEGLYFGAELDEQHPAVVSGTPLHGRNLFPESPRRLRDTVLEYLDTMTEVGHLVSEGLALSLGLERSYFRERYVDEPLILFRIFHYPPLPGAAPDRWSVGEHTDYGFLTLLRQDMTGGLQVKTGGNWIDAPPIEDAFVCNIGDMLDRMTGGYYRSTPHRVLNRSSRSRLSFPFFFDPSFDAEIHPISPRVERLDDSEHRWDGANVHAFEGTYGEYLMAKIGKVFPELGTDHLGSDPLS